MAQIDLVVNEIDYPNERNHDHYIELTGLNLDSLSDVPDDIILLPIKND